MNKVFKFMTILLVKLNKHQSKSKHLTNNSPKVKNLIKADEMIESQIATIRGKSFDVSKILKNNKEDNQEKKLKEQKK